MRHSRVLAAVAVVFGTAPFIRAGDDRSGPDKAQGWVVLFEGKNTSGWVSKKNTPLPTTCVQDGSLNPHFPGSGGLVYTKERYGNFVLACDFKVSKGCNSGIFFRVGDPRDEVQTGFVIQVLDSAGRAKIGKHDCGALYDAVAPGKNAMKPAGEWNHIEITADGPMIKVVLNGEQIVETDLDRFTEPHKNIDGTTNKYNKALKDFPREGYIGLQDHGHDVWYKNMKLKVIK